jgi:AraC-like DNA-binding protein
MNSATPQPAKLTKFWLLPQLDDLELFRANAIHHHYARHFHSSYSIGVIESGVGGNDYQGTTYLAPPGSIVLMNPGVPHTGFSAEGLPLTYRMLYPSVECVQKIADEFQMNGTPYFRDAVVQDDELTRQILSLHALLEQSPNSLAQESVFVEVLSRILGRHTNIKTNAMRHVQEHRAVQLMKDYFHDHYSKNISLEQLVALTNLNRSYLIRIFRQSVGMPPYTYLNQIRVEKAKQFLSQGISIAETAIAVGMSDQSHLTRHFKRIIGVSPGHYRTMSTSFKTRQS